LFTRPASDGQIDAPSILQRPRPPCGGCAQVNDASKKGKNGAMPGKALIDKDFIVSTLTAQDPFCFSHGAGDTSEHLGAGILYYALAYSLRARTCMCLGSGGGFVPRMLRQAQRDLELDGSRTILVDGAGKVPETKKNVWGSPAWLSEDSLFRRNYPEIELVLELTADAYNGIFAPQGLEVEYLHIDADHHYEGVKEDWELYKNLVPARGIITLHDTMNYREPCGVFRLVEEIRQLPEYSIIDLPVSFGTAIVQKNPVSR